MKLLRLVQMLLALAITTTLVFTPQSILAYGYSGIHWNINYAYYDMSGVPSSWQYPIMDAASTWNQAGADWMFAGSSSGNDVTLGNDDPWVLARTYVSYSNYIILDCDVVFNTSDFLFQTDGQDPDVQSVMCHEFGHWLMLNDISDSNSMMNSSYTGGHTLSQDDISGIIYIYGS